MSPTRDPPSILGEEFLFFPSEEQIHFSCQLTVEFQRGINVDDLECSLSRSLDERLVSTQGRKLQVARSFWAVLMSVPSPRSSKSTSAK